MLPIYFLTALSSLLLLVFSLQLFLVNTGNRYLNRLLALFLFSRFTENLVYVLILSGKFAFFPISLKLFGPLSLSLSAPAFFYLYLSGFLKDKFSFDKRDWVHFIPCIISFVDISAIFWQSSADIAVNVKQIGLKKSFIYEERIGVFSGLHLFYIRQGLYAFYFLILGSIIYKSRIIQRWDWKPAQNRWVVFIFVSIFLLQYSRFTIAFLADKVEYSNSGLLTIVVIISTSIIFVIMLYLLSNPKLLYGFIFINKYNAIDSFTTFSPLLKEIIDKKIKNTDLFSLDRKELYISAILGFMSDHKPYLNPDFRIIHISEKLNIPVHHCSYIINYEFDKNFRDWINAYRVAFFVEQFHSKYAKMTIEAIACESGFSTPATFYNAFNKEKGVSPTIFFKK
jgi:AraC-like DNA-binding protein